MLWFALALLAFLPGTEGASNFHGGPDFERQRDIFLCSFPSLHLILPSVVVSVSLFEDVCIAECFGKSGPTRGSIP